MKNNKTLDNSREISDEGLTLLFDAKEAGKSFPDAVATLGTDEQTADLTLLRSLWDLHGNLTREAHNISPNSRLLQRTLDALPTVAPVSVVTTPAGTGYINESENATGFFTQVSSNFSRIMHTNWKVALPISVIVFALVSVVSLSGKDQPLGQQLAMKESSDLQAIDTATLSVMQDSALMSQSAGEAGNEVSLMSMTAATETEGDAPQLAISRSMSYQADAPVTGEIDDLAASIVLEASGDLTLFDNSNGDLTLVYSDRQAINDFNTSYDETTF